MNSGIEIIEINVKLNIRCHPIINDDFLFSFKNLYRIHHHLNPDRL